MIRALKQRAAGRETPERFGLGHLELKVMEILWARGDGNVSDVAGKLSRPRAYTTVMTTLDRLFKKGLLDRRKLERAFVYKPRLSRPQWERKHAGELVDAFLTGPRPSGELLISCLVEAVGDRDKALLDRLEETVQRKRKELEQRKNL
jgi:predicted transcriptional regulator